MDPTLAPVRRQAVRGGRDVIEGARLGDGLLTLGLGVGARLVDDRVLVQVVADRTLTPAHKTETLRGLAAGGVEVGLVFNFGLPELFFSRML